MTELRIPLGRYTRRIFWTVVGSACLLLIVTRFLIVPLVFGSERVDAAVAVDQSLGDIFATVIAATVLSGVVLWLTRPSKKSTDLVVVHPRDIRPTLEQNLKRTRSWWYSGSVGRWNRARVLPELAAASRRTNVAHNVTLSILDPRDEAACAAYATYRRGVRTGQDADWSSARVRCDLLATIVAAAVMSDEHPLLDIRIILKRSSSILRVDASDEQLILTREDPNEPALVCDQGSYFYDAFRQNLVFEQSQGKVLTFSPHGATLAALDSEQAQAILDSLGFEASSFDPGELQTIIDMAKSDAHPYGRN